jgi:hypothetical protein
MNENVYKKLSEDYIKRVITKLNNFDIIEKSDRIYVLNQQIQEWVFDIGLTNLYIGFNYEYFNVINTLYGFKSFRTNKVLLNVAKLKLNKYKGKNKEIIDSLQEFDVQPSLMTYDTLDKLLNENSND